MIVRFDSQYAAGVEAYAAMLRAGCVCFAADACYDKRRRALNRMQIATPSGRQTLTVPLARPHASQAVADVVIAEHANWRHNHWGALYSAYGRTPFFEYFADTLRDILFDESITRIFDLNLAIHNAVVDFLDLPISTVADTADAVPAAIEPLSGTYYQIWQQRHGFIPSLSILDLLFNVGREAIFFLRNE